MSRSNKINMFIKILEKLASKKLFQFVLFLALAYLWTSFTSSFLAVEWGWDIDNSKPTTMKLAQIFSVPLLACIFLLLINWGLFLKNKIYIVLVLIYILLNLILFFSIAPGCFTEDSFYTFHMVKNGWWDGWYSSLHLLLITALIQIIPWDFNAPSIFLVMLWLAIYTSAHFILIKMKAPKLIHIGLFLLSFVPAQLAASIIIVRDSYFSAIFIAFILFYFYLVAVKKNINLPNLYTFVALGAFLSFYRSDSFPSVAIGIFFLAYFFVSKNLKMLNECPALRGRLIYIVGKLLLAIVIPFLAFFFISSMPPYLLKDAWVKGNTWGKRAELEYKLTLIENPLGYIVRNRGEIAHEQKVNIEKIFTIENLELHWCPGNLCLFYGGHWNKNSSKSDRDAAFNSALVIFLHNPKLFINSRLETLAAVGDKNSQTTCSRITMYERGFPNVLEVGFVKNIGDFALKSIRNTETNEGVFGGKRLWWNVYLSVFILSLVLIFFKLAPVAGVISLIVLLRSFIVFLAAPAGFTVYYTTLFIGAPIVFLLFLSEANKTLGSSHKPRII